MLLLFLCPGCQIPHGSSLCPFTTKCRFYKVQHISLLTVAKSIVSNTSKTHEQRNYAHTGQRALCTRPAQTQTHQKDYKDKRCKGSPPQLVSDYTDRSSCVQDCNPFLYFYPIITINNQTLYSSMFIVSIICNPCASYYCHYVSVVLYASVFVDFCIHNCRFL